LIQAHIQIYFEHILMMEGLIRPNLLAIASRFESNQELEFALLASVEPLVTSFIPSNFGEFLVSFHRDALASALHKKHGQAAIIEKVFVGLALHITLQAPQLGPCHVKDVPAGKVLVCGRMKAGKSCLINGLLGRYLAPSDRGNRTTVFRAKYRIPEAEVIFIDAIGVETNDAIGTLARSIPYVKHCHDRLVPARHVCAGILCITATESAYQDVDADIFDEFRKANVPALIVLTRAYTADAADLKDKIEADPRFQGAQIEVVNSIRAVGWRGTVLSDPIGLEELGIALKACVEEGRGRVKPNAIAVIQRRFADLSALQAAIVQDRRAWQDSNDLRDLLRRFRQSDKRFATLLRIMDGDAAGVDRLLFVLIQTDLAFLQQSLDDLFQRVSDELPVQKSDESDIIGRLRQVEVNQQERRRYQLAVWTNEQRIRQQILEKTSMDEITDWLDFNTRFQAVKPAPPESIALGNLPDDVAAEKAQLDELVTKMKQIQDENVQLIAHLTYTVEAIQKDWEPGTPRAQLAARLQEMEQRIAHIQAKETEFANQFTERDVAIRVQKQLRDHVRGIAQRLRQVTDSKNPERATLISSLEEAQVQIELHEVAQKNATVALNAAVKAIASIRADIYRGERAMAALEEQVHMADEARKERKQNAEAQLHEITTRQSAIAELEKEMHRLEERITFKIEEGTLKAELLSTIMDRDRKQAWEAKTAKMTTHAQPFVKAYSEGVTSAKIQDMHCWMAQEICSAFGIQGGPTDWDALFSKSSRGGRANYMKKKSWWDMGAHFARCETMLFGTSLIDACRKTRGIADGHLPQTIDAVIANFQD
jgi:GTP-binding protein EngB required for normal cell division